MIYKQLPDGRIVPASTYDAQPVYDRTPTPPPMPTRSPMRGAGDVVARVTGALGIQPCDACEQRRRLLNSMFPFGRR